MSRTFLYQSILFNNTDFYLPSTSHLWKKPLDSKIIVHKDYSKKYGEPFSYFSYTTNVIIDDSGQIKVKIDNISAETWGWYCEVSISPDKMIINGISPYEISEDLRHYYYKNLWLKSDYTGYDILRASPNKMFTPYNGIIEREFENETNELWGFDKLFLCRFENGILVNSLDVSDSKRLRDEKRNYGIKSGTRAILKKHLDAGDIWLHMTGDKRYKELDYEAICDELEQYLSVIS